MSGKLSNLRIGSLKTNRQTRSKPVGLPSAVIQSQQAADFQALSSIPEYLLIQQRIPGSQSFLNRDLIPDLIDMLRRDGSKMYIDSLPQTEDKTIIVSGTEPIKASALFDIFKFQTWEVFLNTLYPYTGYGPQELTNIIYEYGLQELARSMAAADPQDPQSIIFRHSSQEIHIKTQEIEIDIIKNEPEVGERDDLQCGCGSRRIRAIQVQMRSADEPPTILATCVACKTNWRQSAA